MFACCFSWISKSRLKTIIIYLPGKKVRWYILTKDVSCSSKTIYTTSHERENSSDLEPSFFYDIFQGFIWKVIRKENIISRVTQGHSDHFSAKWPFKRWFLEKQLRFQWNWNHFWKKNITSSEHFDRISWFSAFST